MRQYAGAHRCDPTISPCGGKDVGAILGHAAARVVLSKKAPRRVRTMPGIRGIDQVQTDVRSLPNQEAHMVTLRITRATCAPKRKWPPMESGSLPTVPRSGQDDAVTGDQVPAYAGHRPRLCPHGRLPSPAGLFRRGGSSSERFYPACPWFRQRRAGMKTARLIWGRRTICSKLHAKRLAAGTPREHHVAAGSRCRDCCRSRCNRR